MLTRANRVVKADDFRLTVRRGRRVGTPHAIVYLRTRSFGEPTRFGFIVAKTVGNAVTRNLMRRRLRSIGRDFIESSPTGESSAAQATTPRAGVDIVIRALPGSAGVSWATLHKEISTGVERGVSKQ